MNRKETKDSNAEVNLADSVLCPESWPFSLEWLPVPAFMVGGAVRDALLGRRREYLDLDFVLPTGAVETASTIARHYQAGFVLLDAQRQIARVVFKNATADFAQQEGESLETDLHRRDFTINAIAYNPHTEEIIDPLQGYADLQQGMIRMVSPANLADDPLRLLRGYRQAAQLGFAIAPETRSAIGELAPKLSQIAAERVRVELSYLLGSPQGTPWLSAAWEDGILRWILHDNITARNLAILAEIDRATANFSQVWPTLSAALYSTIPGLAADAKRTWIAIAKYASLLIPENWLFQLHTLPVTLNYTRSEIAIANSSIEDFMKRMTYSVPEIRAVNIILKFLPQLRSPNLSLREQYFFFQEVGAVFPALTVVAVATGTQIESLASLIDRYLDPNDQVAHPTQLINGKDLMQALNLPPSPQIGQLLTEIQLARIEGKISTSADALKLANQIIKTDIHFHQG
ncbi:MAG TPA: CCA tRNA nucleotidyltransferase [Leptolyngbyaceae cyanobacterium]